MFEISKVYDFGLQRDRELKIKVCGKDSIPLVKYIGMVSGTAFWTA